MMPGLRAAMRYARQGAAFGEPVRSNPLEDLDGFESLKTSAPDGAEAALPVRFSKTSSPGARSFCRVGVGCSPIRFAAVASSVRPADS
jgi:hypothetical protein